eukprot:7146673-Pyramimonas_sp.AAC.1
MRIPVDDRAIGSVQYCDHTTYEEHFRDCVAGCSEHAEYADDGEHIRGKYLRRLTQRRLAIPGLQP